MTMSSTEAQTELGVLEARAKEQDRLDAFVRFTNAGLPQEIIRRLEALWDAREEIGGRVVHTGRIIFMEVNRFIDENPRLALGVALGAAVGALPAMIPWIGPALAPFALAAGVLIGATAGHRLDEGVRAKHGIIRVAQDIIEVARKFFELLARIFNALRTVTDAAGGEVPA